MARRRNHNAPPGQFSPTAGNLPSARYGAEIDRVAYETLLGSRALPLFERPARGSTRALHEERRRYPRLCVSLADRPAHASHGTLSRWACQAPMEKVRAAFGLSMMLF